MRGRFLLKAVATPLLAGVALAACDTQEDGTFYIPNYDAGVTNPPPQGSTDNAAPDTGKSKDGGAADAATETDAADGGEDADTDAATPR